MTHGETETDAFGMRGAGGNDSVSASGGEDAECAVKESGAAFVRPIVKPERATAA